MHRVVHVDEDQAGRAELKALGHRQTPVVVTATGESWSGHNATFLSALLPDSDDTDAEAPTTNPGAAGPGGRDAGGRDVTPTGVADRRVVGG